MIIIYRNLITSLLVTLKPPLTHNPKFNFAINNIYLPSEVSNQPLQIPINILNKPKLFLPTNFITKKKQKYIVYKNYLLPQRPQYYKTLQIFLYQCLDHQYQYTPKQWKYLLKNIKPTFINLLNNLMHKKNLSIYQQQLNYDFLTNILDDVPCYYSMLLARTSTNNNYQLQCKAIQNKLINIDNSQNNHNIAIKQQKPTLQTGKQIYKKLYLIHPYFKQSVYQQYVAQCKKLLQSSKTLPNIVTRMPCLFFMHPYQLYIIDQYKKSTHPLKPQQYHLSGQHIAKYPQHWQTLSQTQRLYYEDKAQHYLLQYQSQIHQALIKTNLSKLQLYKLIQNQFIHLNHKITIQPQIKLWKKKYYLRLPKKKY